MNSKPMIRSVVRSTEFGVAGGALLGILYTLLNVWLFTLTSHPSAGVPSAESNLLAYILGPIVGLIFGGITGLVIGTLYGFLFLFISGRFFESSDDTTNYRTAVRTISFVCWFLGTFAFMLLFSGFSLFYSFIHLVLRISCRVMRCRALSRRFIRCLSVST